MFLASGEKLLCFTKLSHSFVYWRAVSWILFESVDLEDRLCHNQGLMMLHSMWDLSMIIEPQQATSGLPEETNSPLKNPQGLQLLTKVLISTLWEQWFNFIKSLLLIYFRSHT